MKRTNMTSVFAIKLQISKPTFGKDYSGRDNADFSDREPTASQDGDHHATIPKAEIDPVEMSDMEKEVLNQVFMKINQGSVKSTPAGWMGLRIVMLPSDGRV